MNSNSRVKLLLLLFGLCLALSTGTGCKSEDGDAPSTRGDTERADKWLDADTGPAQQLDVGADVKVDIASDIGSDTPMRSRRCPEEEPSNSSPYLCDEDCGFVDRDPAREFRIPDRPEYGGRLTAKELKERFPNGQFPTNGGSLRLPDSAEPNQNHDEAWLRYGQDLRIYFAPVQSRAEYGDSTIKVTVVLNYKPVDATYEHVSGDRRTVLRRVEGHAGEFPVDGPIELIDVTIPSEAFERKGRYDVGIGWNAYGDITRPGGWERIRVYYGGTEPPTHRCVRRGSITDRKDVELSISKRYFADAVVYPGGRHANKGPFDPIEVDAGEQVAVDYGVDPLTDARTAMAIVPMMNGEPLDKRIFAFTPERRGIRKTGFRDRFIVQIPNDPGEYEVELGMWPLPFLDRADWHEFDLASNGHYNGTNHLKFVVKE